MAFRTRIGIKAGRPEKRWTPASLSTPSLAVAFALFLSLLIGLLLVKYVVNHGSGFVLLSRNPYTWVYGPTALLVIITSLWRQVDYHCKALRPWSELQKAPADADRTLLLDLVSPFQLVSVVNAATKRHNFVALTITGFLIVKSVTIASTGLLDLATAVVGPIDADARPGKVLATQMFYRRYMAQVMSDKMRLPVSSSGQYGAQDIIVTTPNITGTQVADGQVPRLVQHRTPKLVLEIMLGLMFVCGVLAWVIGHQKYVVPWNPCTIAGVMVLFAGSKMAGHRSQLRASSLPSEAAHQRHCPGTTPSGKPRMRRIPTRTNTNVPD